MQQIDDTSFTDILSHDFWRHRIPLPNGEYTPGYRRDPSDWHRFGLPDDLSGQSFIDIGAGDGLFAFEAEKRGAENVVAMDIWGGGYESWDDSDSLGQYMREGLNLVKQYCNSTVRPIQGDLADISVDKIGTYDVVLCSGVFQYVSDPYTAIKNLIDITDELLVFRCKSTLFDTNEPVIGFSCNDTPQIWRPSPEALFSMFNTMGGGRIEKFPEDSVSIEREFPPVWEAFTRSDANLYRTPALEDQIGVVPSNTRCDIAYEHDNSYRINYQNEVNQQGWIRSAALEQRDESNMFKKFYDIISNDGLMELFHESGQFFIRRSEKLERMIDKPVNKPINIHYHA